MLAYLFHYIIYFENGNSYFFNYFTIIFLLFPQYFSIVRNRMYLLHLFQNIGFHIFQFAGFPGTLCFFLGNRIDNLEVQCFPRHTAAALLFIEMCFPLFFRSILELIRIKEKLLPPSGMIIWDSALAIFPEDIARSTSFWIDALCLS